MERRIGQRARTDFEVIVKSAHRIDRCRGLELSTSGLLLELDDSRVDDRASPWVGLEVLLPGTTSMIFARGLHVRSTGGEQAFTIDASDADRLSLAEHVDHHASFDLRSPN